MSRLPASGLTMKFIIPSGLVVLLVMAVATVYLVRNQKEALVAEVREQKVT